MKAYFFTNEKLASFLATDHFANLDRVFGIGGGGDFAFNLLALHAPTQIILCDNNLRAVSAAHFKINLIKHSTHDEFLSFLSSEKLRTIKKSKQYYPDSFKAAAHINDYLAYLSSPEKYLVSQQTIKNVEVILGDFTAELEKQTSDFELIYLSNLLETKLCRTPGYVLDICRAHLSDEGKIVFASQDTPKIVERFLSKNSFTQIASEIHAFSTLQAILGHYSYSFYLCKPTEPSIHPHPRS